ncbi:MAG: hypothetical protein ABIF01_05700 [Candidatus Micrarchaeota archaeon]
MVLSRGQSATEQLITYGWAGMILVVIIAILVYFGVLSFGNAIPERCVFQTGFLCKSHRLYLGPSENLTVRFEVVSKFSRRITIKGVLCSSESPNPATGYPLRGLINTDISILPEGIKSIVLQCYNKDGSINGISGESYQGLIYLKYSEDLGYASNLGNITGEHIKVANIAGKIN